MSNILQDLESEIALFRALVGEWLSDSLWKVILRCSGLWWQNLT